MKTSAESGILAARLVTHASLKHAARLMTAQSVMLHQLQIKRSKSGYSMLGHSIDYPSSTFLAAAGVTIGLSLIILLTVKALSSTRPLRQRTVNITQVQSQAMSVGQAIHVATEFISNRSDNELSHI